MLTNSYFKIRSFGAEFEMQIQILQGLVVGRHISSSDNNFDLYEVSTLARFFLHNTCSTFCVYLCRRCICAKKYSNGLCGYGVHLRIASSIAPLIFITPLKFHLHFAKVEPARALNYIFEWSFM